jgi:hypothetical protein
MQVEAIPGEYGPPNEPGHDGFKSDGNLSWSHKAGPAFTGNFFEKLRLSASKHDPPADWDSHSLFADPKFASFSDDPKADIDPRLSADSAAIDAGVALPSDWPDPLRASDAGKPDMGALPLGAQSPTLLNPR